MYSSREEKNDHKYVPGFTCLACTRWFRVQLHRTMLGPCVKSVQELEGWKGVYDAGYSDLARQETLGARASSLLPHLEFSRLF